MNVYYDRTEYTLHFQDQYTYTETTSNNGTQYGVVDGSYAMIYRDRVNGVWRTTNNNNCMKSLTTFTKTKSTTIDRNNSIVWSKYFGSIPNNKLR